MITSTVVSGENELVRWVMEKHVAVLGALFVGLGIMGMIGILIVLAIFCTGTVVLATVAAHEPDLPALVTWLPLGFGFFISVLIALSTVPSLIAGYGLFAKRPWAPSVSLVAGVLNLPAFPLGTGTGIYAIWVYLTYPGIERKGVQPA